MRPICDAIKSECDPSVPFKAILNVSSMFDDYRDDIMNCDCFGEVDDCHTAVRSRLVLVFFVL